jgi:Zn ribbon nucleic-acid-binding protein
MERVVVCPVCKDTDSCFEEMQENFSSYMCFNCGYMSDSRYRVGSVELVDNMIFSKA